MRNHGPDTVPRWCCLVCLGVLRRHWTQQAQKRKLLFARNHALRPWTISICVDACSRSSCVDSIHKNVWLRGCGPSLCVCMLVVVVAVLSAYDYDCARSLWASRRFGGEAGLADRESLQLRPFWPNIEPQMIGQKEKKSWIARPRFADQSAAPKTSPQ